MYLYLIVAAAGYLLGSIPFGYLLMRWIRKQDIREQGSGNIGATNVMRSGAKGLGALTFLLDAGKGYAAVACAEYMARNSGNHSFQDAAILAGFAAIVGHIFPLWLRFKGGKGVATALGVFLALSAWAALAALGFFIIILSITRYVSLASILAAIVFPFFTLFISRGSHTALFRVVVFCCSALVVVKHKDNIVRLMHGAEYRFGKPKPSKA
jgi:acyl phosphate:glycerol-3-phosphate acyltransferase